MASTVRLTVPAGRDVKRLWSRCWSNWRRFPSPLRWHGFTHRFGQARGRGRSHRDARPVDRCHRADSRSSGRYDQRARVRTRPRSLRARALRLAPDMWDDELTTRLEGQIVVLEPLGLITRTACSPPPSIQRSGSGWRRSGRAASTSPPGSPRASPSPRAGREGVFATIDRASGRADRQHALPEPARGAPGPRDRLDLARRLRCGGRARTSRRSC